jgi:hypothetical protein
MKRKTIRVTVTDGAGSWRHTRDSTLAAVSPGKILILGTTWVGDLRPKVDAMLDQLQALVTPFTTGRTLNAEQLAPQTGLLGRTWTGDLQARLTRAATPTGDTDMSRVFQELEALHIAMGTANAAEVADRIGRVRRAADAVGKKSRTTTDSNWGTRFLNQSRLATDTAITNLKRTAPAGGTAGAVRDALATGDGASDMRSKVAAMNRANAAFWDRS